MEAEVEGKKWWVDVDIGMGTISIFMAVVGSILVHQFQKSKDYCNPH